MRVPQVLFGLLVYSASFAAEATSVEELFAERFEKHYTEGECGLNAYKFVEAVEKQFGNAEDYTIVTITNRGYTVFGLVNAEHARGEKFKKPAVKEVNWHDHVIVIDKDGLVYDFDFGIEVKIVKVDEYFETMFLDEPECKESRDSEFCAGRENKLNDYELELVKGDAALAEKKPKAETMRLKAFLERFEE